MEKEVTIYNCLASKKDNIIQKLKNTKSLTEANAVMADAMDMALYQYVSEMEDDTLKDEASHMIRCVINTLPVIESATNTKVWERTEKEGAVKTSKFWLILLVLAAAALGYGSFVLWTRYGKVLVLEEVQYALYGIVIGLVLLFFAGMALAKRKKKESDTTEKQVEVRVDAEQCYRALTAAALETDKQLKIIKERLEKDSVEDPQSVLTKEEISLYSALLEASAVGDGQMALEEAENLRHYLYKRGVDLVDYDKNNETWFETLPGTGKTITIRPAMACNGVLLKKGLASGGDF